MFRLFLAPVTALASVAVVLVPLIQFTSPSLDGVAWAEAGPSRAFTVHATQSVGATQSALQSANAQLTPKSFDGSPNQPQAWRAIDFDVTVHGREVYNGLDPLQAQHGADCGAPPAAHPISADGVYDDAVFLCKNHVMTALSSGSYGLIYLTPDSVVDFSGGEAHISFDLSTVRTSPRDWVDLWISPYEDHLQLPVEDGLPDGNGEPRRAVHIRMDNTDDLPDDSMFRASIFRNFKEQELDGQTWVGIKSFLTPSATRRDTFELDLSRTHLKFGMPQYNFWWFDTDIADLGWTGGVVQFGHHSYDPLKGCENTCAPNTWHWDNISIYPAVPFAIAHGDRRVVDATTPGTVTFAGGAPQEAHLRFVGIGDKLQFSVDGGQTWQQAQVQAQKSHDDGHFQSYWTPIPAGVTSVQLRGEEFWGGDWQIRDISIWGVPGG